MPASGLSSEPGFFEWNNLALYGRCSSHTVTNTASGKLSDESSHSTSQEECCCLPFDPAEVIDNLRWERYVHAPVRWARWRRDFMRQIYYYFRPHLRVRWRAPLQRLYFRHRHRLQFPHWPVDTTVEGLGEALMTEVCRRNREQKVPFIWFWPNGDEGCVMMTHDVEEAAGLEFCGQLMEINEEFGLRSSFQLVPEGRYTVPSGFIDEILRRGFEVNIQDLNHDGKLFQDRAEFERRAVRIEQYRQKFAAKGFRSAIMYRNQDWYDQLHFQYDMSVPNVASLEVQQGGCCTVMPYFVGDILELPLTTVEDYTLFHILRSYSISLWKEQMDLILAKNGLVSFLVHPDYIRDSRERDVYLELLGYLNSARAHRKLWFALPGEVNDWWRQRSALELVATESGWAIRGQGSERARVAYASLSNGEVVYELASRGGEQPSSGSLFHETHLESPPPGALATRYGPTLFEASGD